MRAAASADRLGRSCARGATLVQTGSSCRITPAQDRVQRLQRQRIGELRDLLRRFSRLFFLHVVRGIRNFRTLRVVRDAAPELDLSPVLAVPPADGDSRSVRPRAVGQEHGKTLTDAVKGEPNAVHQQVLGLSCRHCPIGVANMPTPERRRPGPPGDPSPEW